MQSAPLWLRNATLPGRARVAAKVALKPLCGIIAPRQFGPSSRIRPLRASASTRRSNSTPASPRSLNPAEMMIAPFTPAATHSAMIPGTVGAGVAMIASSICSGTSAIVGYALMPST